MVVRRWWLSSSGEITDDDLAGLDAELHILAEPRLLDHELGQPNPT